MKNIGLILGNAFKSPIPRNEAIPFKKTLKILKMVNGNEAKSDSCQLQ
jgi:hypothetical protein